MSYHLSACYPCILSFLFKKLVVSLKASIPTTKKTCGDKWNPQFWLRITRGAVNTWCGKHVILTCLPCLSPELNSVGKKMEERRENERKEGAEADERKYTVHLYVALIGLYLRWARSFAKLVPVPHNEAPLIVNSGVRTRTLSIIAVSEFLGLAGILLARLGAWMCR